MNKGMREDFDAYFDRLNVSPLIKSILYHFAESPKSNYIKYILVDGGFGGDPGWGIHNWDEDCFEDYGVDKFDGYRFYVEVDPIDRRFIDEHVSEKRMEELLNALEQWKNEFNGRQ